MAATMDSGPRQMCSEKTSNCQDSVELTTTSEPETGYNLTGNATDCTSASASTDLMALLQRSHKEFYKDRKIIVRNVPPCSYEEVKRFMNGHIVCNITISKKSRHAVVTLQDGEKALEIAAALDNTSLLNTEVSVSFYPSDRLICVAHLPAGFTEENFEDLVSTYGPVEKCYLMRDEFTGESKGYGFVEYCLNREKSIPAREELDWKTVDRSCIQCDFVSGHQAEYSQLNSRCLLVENLPKDFRDDCQLRDIFSLYSSPAYCRILVKDNESSMGIAIVEYTDHEVASRTKHQLNESTVHGSHVTISYCLLGKTAIDIYNRFMLRMDSGKGGNSHKSGLLPNPVLVNESIINSPLMKSLTNRQPRLMPKLRRALKELQTGYRQHQGTNKQGLLGPAPSVMNPLMNPNLQLGLATMLALQLQGQTSLMRQVNAGAADALNLLTLLQPSMTQNALSGMKPSLLGDPFTAQAKILVQNLMSQLKNNPDGQSSLPDGSPSTEDPTASWEQHSDLMEQNLKNLNMNWLVNLGQIVTTIQQNLQQMPPSSGTSGAFNQSSARTSLLGDASNYFGGGTQNMAGSSWESQIHQTLKSELLNERNVGGNMAEDTKENFLRNLQTLAAQYSGSKGFVPQSSNNNNIVDNNNTTYSHSNTTSYRGNSLLGDFGNTPFGQNSNNNNNPANGFYNQNENNPLFSHNGGNSNMTNTSQSMNGNGFPQKPALLPEPVPYSNPTAFNPNHNNNNYINQAAVLNVQKPPPLLPSPFPGPTSQNISSSVSINPPGGNVQKPPPLLPSPFPGPQNINSLVPNNPPGGNGQKPPPLLPSPFRGPTSQNINSLVSNNMQTNSGICMKPPSLLPDPSYSKPPQQFPQMSSDVMPKSQALLPNPVSHSSHNFSLGLASQSNQSNKMEHFVKQQPLLPDPIPHLLHSEPYSPVSGRAGRVGAVGSKSGGLLATPVGKKRSYSCLLPAPEASPDGDYVGQHSQGIGGHYADTYSVKRPRGGNWQPQSLFRT